MAGQTSITYTFGGVSVGIPDTGTRWTSADKIMHQTGGESISYSYGYPWGTGIQTQADSLATSHWNLNVDTQSDKYLSGSGVGHFSKEFPSGTLDLTSVTYKFEGLATSFTYQGPTFTTTLPVYGTITVTNGQVFTGAFLIIDGGSTGHGEFTSGDYRVSETVINYQYLAGPYAGLSILWGEGTATTIG